MVAALWIKAACEDARSLGFEQAREGLKNRFFRMAEAHSVPPKVMERLPMSIVGAVKSVALRGGTDVHFDERYFMLRLMGRCSIDRLMALVKPRVLCVLPLTTFF